MSKFRLETNVQTIMGLNFAPFNTNPQKLATVRYQNVVAGTAQLSLIHTDALPNSNRRFYIIKLWQQARGEYRVDSLLECLVRLKIITKEEKEEHLTDVKREREKIDKKRMANDLCSFIENDLLMADVTHHLEHLDDMLTSDKEDDRRLASALCYFKQVLNGTPSWEIENG